MKSPTASGPSMIGLDLRLVRLDLRIGPLSAESEEVVVSDAGDFGANAGSQNKEC